MIRIGRETLRRLLARCGSSPAPTPSTPNHTVQTRALNAYPRWRNANARHPDGLAAQRRERVRFRSEKGLRWGGRPLVAAA